MIPFPHPPFSPTVPSMTTGNQVITISHLHKSYGSLKAVKDLSFSVDEGNCLALLGPNGAGKTTAMKMLYGKAVPEGNPETAMDIFGYDPRKDQLSIKALTGVVTQEDSLDEELDVVQNLRIYAKFYGHGRKYADGRIDELLAFMELQEKRKARIRELSGGMKRRLVIARALLNEPKLLILDEPTTGLDPQVRQLIWNKMEGLKRQGVTILLTTHYMDEAAQLADNLIIMDKGSAILEGEPRTLLERELEPFVLEIKNPRVVQDLDLFFFGDSSEATDPGVEQKAAGKDSIRKEEYPERAFYFGRDLGRLNDAVRSLSPRDYHIRQINLEDLFLKATGRQLNELQ